MAGWSCEGCTLHSRREFVAEATRSALLALAGVGLLPHAAAGMPRVIAAQAKSAAEMRYPIPVADGVSIDADAAVILSRSGGRVYAFSLACPHQRTALRWEEANTRFRCPKHKSVFRPDGSFVEGKADRPMDRYSIRRDGDVVVVDTDAVHRFDRAREAWEAAVVTL